MEGDGTIFSVCELWLICTCSYDTNAYDKARDLWDRVSKSNTIKSIRVTKKEVQQ